ncbi:MAG TPA: STAS domain-containing protein [Armatimonadota bacterium]|nr:STAS domain-containing protein [Armatimonadota bacterium]
MSNLIGLTVRTRRVNARTAVVTLEGEMDIFTTPRARATMLRLLDDGCHDLIVDLRQAAYLDSTALGALLGMLRRARERGGGVRLLAPSHSVYRLLEITRLTLAFPIDATEHDALAAVGGRQGDA